MIQMVPIMLNIQYYFSGKLFDIQLISIPIQLITMDKILGQRTQIKYKTKCPALVR